MQIDGLIGPALGYFEAISGNPELGLPRLMVIRRDEVSTFEAVVYEPVICLILQGTKETSIGDQVRTLRAGDALVVSHDLPVQSKILQASPDRPYLAVILGLDLSLIRSLYEKIGARQGDGVNARSLSSGPVDPGLIDPIARYFALMRSPMDAEVLGPAILREIHYRLLMSPIGGMLRSLLSIDSHASRVARAILKIRTDFRRSLSVVELAQLAGMSPSSFHGHFKQVTGTTPLQYQKDLRMIAAQDLLRTGRHSVSAAGFQVGYESPTHFSRDYQRKFGVAPSREAVAA